MEPRVLCMRDAARSMAFQLELGKAGLEVVFAEGDVESGIGYLLRGIRRIGAPLRTERFSPGRFDVDVENIGPESPRFLDACAALFRERGWSARVYSGRLADLWKRLQMLQVPADLRESISERLDAVPEQGLIELEMLLDRALDEMNRTA